MKQSIAGSGTGSARRRYDLLLGGFIMAVMTLIIIAGCSGGGAGSGEGTHENHDTGSLESEMYYKTASFEVMPDFLKNHTKLTNDLYQAVARYEDIATRLNCYCGCMGGDDPHDSLFRCYVASKDADGVTWTDHSAHCGICKQELVTVMELADQGKSFEEIEAAIESMYNPDFTPEEA
ncbi:PCYCGC domain-containing protein [Paenibacillus tarimensis]|uniref:PCYCGC domain-containing protein n=1 Tax=Paenibacillus tarimensis TaxID=416012 RepID=UPI001F485691|nr:PCYCGC domain-containing protein [Paenibacillus tarimensis]MCF2943249.1 PCYCGC domain-containing protein [Paenibacillus tarimensis]